MVTDVLASTAPVESCTVPVSSPVEIAFCANAPWRQQIPRSMQAKTRIVRRPGIGDSLIRQRFEMLLVALTRNESGLEATWRIGIADRVKAARIVSTAPKWLV